MSTDSKKTISLAAKLAAIGKEIGVVTKGGRNTQQNYDYIEYGVVAGRIRELFDKHGIIIIPEVLNHERDEVTNKYGGKGYHYILNMHFTLINADDVEDTREADWLAEGIDYGDKGINKAETSGVKYFLMRLFNISEKGEKEADADSHELTGSTPLTSDPKPAYAKRGVDFNAVRQRLPQIDSIDELNSYWMELKLTDAQAKILKQDFTQRKNELGGE